MTDALKAAREVLVWHENGPRTAQQLKEAKQSGKHGPTKEELAYGLRTALAEVQRLTTRLKEMEEHERHTHEQLGAILGTDDSLEQCALRLTEALRAKDVEIAEAIALVLSHEGRIDRLTAERERLQWVLPVVTGADDDVANGRTAALMMAFGRGLDGIEAIDYAMKERP